MLIGNALNWFEIPVLDFKRAKKFYETIFDYQMPENQTGEARMGFFHHDFKAGKVGGALVFRPGFHQPAASGALIYLNAQPDLQLLLDRVAAAGGQVLVSKNSIRADLGFQAIMLDTEGNRVALHSMG